MILKNIYWYFESALSTRFCDEIIKYGRSKTEQKALVGLDKKTISKKDLKKQRDSNIVWINDEWVYKEITPYIIQANKNAGWNFETDYSESCQFTKYGPGQFYDWHEDAWHEPYNSPDINFNGKIRKLSVTVSLTDPKEYVGGNLQFAQPVYGKPSKEKIVECKEIRPRGSIVVFPSFIKHRVMPVTKGIRNSLVIWNLGKPYI
jgi:PKHD-type hydroxylase